MTKKELFTIYPFFGIHMLIFGSSTFLLAYSEEHANIFSVTLWGGFSIFCYLVFYESIFGRDEVKWMFINSILGILGIISQMDSILLFLTDKGVNEFSWYYHIFPFIYYVMYTFLIHQAVIDFSGSRDNDKRKIIVEAFYIGLSLIYYIGYMI